MIQNFNDPKTGLKLDPECFTNLIGGNSPSLPGGWISYLNGMESSSISADDYTNFIYSKYLTNNPSDTGGKTSTCDVAGNWISGISTAVGIGGMAAFMQKEAAEALAAEAYTSFAFLGPIGFIVTGLVLGGIQIVNADNKCK